MQNPQSSLFFLLLFHSLVVFGQDSAKESDLLDRFQKSVSTGVAGTARRVDSFFANKKLLEDQNFTYLRVFHLTGIKERTNMTNSVHFDLSLQLPGFKKRYSRIFQFNLERQGGEEGKLTPLPEGQLATESEREANDVNAGFSFFNRLKWINTKLSTGLRLSREFNPYFNLRNSREITFTEFSRVRIISNFFGNKLEKLGQSASVDFDFQFYDTWLLRLVSEETYLDKDNTLRTSIGPSLFQRLSDNRHLSYNYRFNANNREAYHLEGMDFSISYRQNLFKNYLFFELTPGISWEKSIDFKSSSFISLKLEILFSEKVF